MPRYSYNVHPIDSLGATLTEQPSCTSHSPVVHHRRPPSLRKSEIFITKRFRSRGNNKVDISSVMDSSPLNRTYDACGSTPTPFSLTTSHNQEKRNEPCRPQSSTACEKQDEDVCYARTFHLPRVTQHSGLFHPEKSVRAERSLHRDLTSPPLRSTLPYPTSVLLFDEESTTPLYEDTPPAMHTQQHHLMERDNSTPFGRLEGSNEDDFLIAYFALDRDDLRLPKDVTSRRSIRPLPTHSRTSIVARTSPHTAHFAHPASDGVGFARTTLPPLFDSFRGCESLANLWERMTATPRGAASSPSFVTAQRTIALLHVMVRLRRWCNDFKRRRESMRVARFQSDVRYRRRRTARPFQDWKTLWLALQWRKKYLARRCMRLLSVYVDRSKFFRCCYLHHFAIARDCFWIQRCFHGWREYVRLRSVISSAPPDVAWKNPRFYQRFRRASQYASKRLQDNRYTMSCVVRGWKAYVQKRKEKMLAQDQADTQRMHRLQRTVWMRWRTQYGLSLLVRFSTPFPHQTHFQSWRRYVHLLRSYRKVRRHCTERSLLAASLHRWIRAFHTQSFLQLVRARNIFQRAIASQPPAALQPTRNKPPPPDTPSGLVVVRSMRKYWGRFYVNLFCYSGMHAAHREKDAVWSALLVMLRCFQRLRIYTATERGMLLPSSGDGSGAGVSYNTTGGDGAASMQHSEGRKVVPPVKMRCGSVTRTSLLLEDRSGILKEVAPLCLWLYQRVQWTSRRRWVVAELHVRMCFSYWMVAGDTVRSDSSAVPHTRRQSTYSQHQQHPVGASEGQAAPIVKPRTHSVTVSGSVVLSEPFGDGEVVHVEKGDAGVACVEDKDVMLASIGSLSIPDLVVSFILAERCNIKVRESLLREKLREYFAARLREILYAQAMVARRLAQRRRWAHVLDRFHELLLEENKAYVVPKQGSH